MADEKYVSKLRDDRIKEHNIDGYTPLKYGYNNKVYKSKTLPKAPDYTPDTYDYDFAEDAIAVKNLVFFQQDRQASNAAGHTAFPTMGYDELKQYVIPIQEHLVKIGYLEEGDVDGFMGPRTEGAIKRYEYNKPTALEEVWHSMKNMDFNFFE
tara:strand:+ start:251 stop:709 length:459 start_codon:yes stop_codon:yes gene_type:complete